MCGINGFTFQDEKLIASMNKALENRGPDHDGIYTDNLISLGHRRLSIIDLSSSGNQPMVNKTNDIIIVYNGEVYNFESIKKDLIEKGYTFTSKTDTEVILYAYQQYGMECLKMFNGMWAIAIYDKRIGKLLLCRDQFGIKPLYYTINGKELIFSSTIAGILCHPIKTSPNDKAIMEMLAFNYQDHGRFTFFNNIDTLDPQTYIEFDLNSKNIEFKKWHSYDSSKTNSTVEDIKKLFIDSVKLRTIADVPVGSCLSGGIDSSAIVGILDQTLKKEFYTFSYIAPNYEMDESKYIEEVGKRTNTKQYFTQIYPAELLNDINDFVETMEEPVAGLSPYAQYRVMKLASLNNVKVILDGQGGDELFAGYITYYSYYFYELFVKLKWFRLVNELLLYKKHYKNIYAIKNFAFMFVPGFLKKVLWKKMFASWINTDFMEKACNGIKDPLWKGRTLQNALLEVFNSYTIPHLLKWEDKNSMRWSIESRVPFLDQKLVESALFIDSSKKISKGETKIIFKEAIKEFLPELILNRKDKIGFAITVNELMRSNEIKEFTANIFNSDKFKSRPYWNASTIIKMHQDFLNGTSNNGDMYWKVLNVELWLRKFFPAL